jgi:phage major head subunit gpT-like protein
MMLINRQNLVLLTTGFKTVFQKAFDTTPSTFERLAMVVPSTTSAENYGWLGAFPRFREWVGDRVIQNLRQHDFTIRNRDFELTIGVDRNSIEDDQYGIYNPMFASMGEQSKTHPDELVYALLKDAFGRIGYDGQYFFDTDHPVLDADGVEQSVSNVQAGAGTPWFLIDTSRAIKPLIFQKRKDYKFTRMDSDQDEAVFARKEFRYGIDARVNTGLGLWQLAFASQQPLDAANYGAARAAMMSFKADGGKPLNIRPTLLVVPPSLETAAFNVVQAEKLASGADNPHKKTAEVLNTAWLA